MKAVEVRLDLNPVSLKQVENLARVEKRSLEDEAAYLLEKGMLIHEHENITNKGRLPHEDR